jgi:vitamin B12 transporter
VKLFVALAALAAPSLSLADVAAENSADPVVVTATRTAQTADETLAAVTVISREQIAASQAKDVAELLRFQAGLDIGRAGGPGQQTSVFVRGTDSNHVVVLVDGVRINPGTIGAPAWQNLDPAMIERIEIVRGPRSTLYGSDAIGGVVQIFTRRAARNTTSVNASAGDGAFDTHDGAFGVHHGGAGWRAGVDVARLQSAGYPAVVGGTSDSGYANNSVNGYLGATLGGVDTEISHWQARGTTDYYDFSLTPVSQDFYNSKSALTLKAAPAPVWATTLRLGQAIDHIDQNQSGDFAHTNRNSVDWQNDLQIGAHDLLTLGAYDGREHTEAVSFGTGYDIYTDTHALYVQNQWKQGAHSLLTAWRTTHHETFGTHQTGEIAYGYQLTTRTRAYASYATAFRAPDSTDRFGYGGNPALNPETSRNTELGLRSQLSATQQAHFQIFQNRIRDLINYVDPDGWLGPLPGMNQNVDEAMIRGAELGYRYLLGPWQLNLEGTSQNPENLATHRQLARRAAHSLTLGSAYTRQDYSLGANALATTSRWDSDYASTRMGGYVLVGVFAQYRIAPDWQLRGRVENLFNEHYVLAEGYRAMGRAFFLQLQYEHASRSEPHE